MKIVILVFNAKLTLTMTLLLNCVLNIVEMAKDLFQNVMMVTIKMEMGAL